MKLTVFNGSPKGKNGNTQVIIDSFVEGLELGGAQVEQFFLSDEDIKHCMGCFDCWVVTPGKCVIKDNMEKLINKFLDADYVLLATPVYGGLMTGLLKNFLDRLLPLANPYISKGENGQFYHEGRIRKLPKFIIVSSAGFPGGKNFEFLKTYFKNYSPMFEIYRNSAGILNESPNNDKNLNDIVKKYRENVKEAGLQFAKEGTVSPELIEKINSNLISDEEYMNAANDYWDSELKKSV